MLLIEQISISDNHIVSIEQKTLIYNTVISNMLATCTWLLIMLYLYPHYTHIIFESNCKTGWHLKTTLE